MKPWLIFAYVQGELRMWEVEAATAEAAFNVLQANDQLQHGNDYHIVEVIETQKYD